MCIYCQYRRLRTHYSLDMSRFQKIYDFMILRHPGTFMVVQNKKSYLATNISIKLSFQSYHYKHLVMSACLSLSYCHTICFMWHDGCPKMFLCIYFFWNKKSWEICHWIVLTLFRMTKKCVTLKSNQYCVCFNHFKIRTLSSKGDKQRIFKTVPTRLWSK